MNTILFDPCPWHKSTLPDISVGLSGSVSDPSVVIRIQCLKCPCVQKTYYPTEEELKLHYRTRYSENRKLIKAVMPKLLLAWNYLK